MSMVVLVLIRTAPFAEVIDIQGITCFLHVPGNLKGGAVIIAVACTGGGTGINYRGVAVTDR